MKTAETKCKESAHTARSTSFLSPKIQSAHQERLAVVYVRQSSPKQVLENRESTARQYAFAEQAVAYGWPPERVMTIDEDLGKSARTTEGRTGFQRMVTEVTLNHVGIVLGLELSRLARSSKDWQAFFEMCGVFGTIIADEDGVYDANDSNDRLLLGLKGIINEMELRTMRNRLYYGRLNKARRGELVAGVPRGYVILPNGNVDRDPDEQVRTVIQLVFDKFEELGSALAVLLWFTSHGIKLPKRLRSGERKGEVEWGSPYCNAISGMLHHPIYAGAYTFGRTSKAKQASRRKEVNTDSSDDCSVLIHDRFPAYITWDQYLRNQERLKENQSRPTTKGVPRQGLSLLAGLVVCGHCGWKLQVTYNARQKLSYRCQRPASTGVKSSCCIFGGSDLEAEVARQVLKALEPAAIQLSLKAHQNVLCERERLHKHWKQKLQRARYDVEIAERRYRAVDAENRLVAATLEKQWEDSLRSERALQEEYDRAIQRESPKLTVDQEHRIEALSTAIPALWNSPDTTNADRKSIIRCLVEKVIVTARLDSEYMDVIIHWVGGWQSQLEVRRRVGNYEQLRDYDQLVNRITELSRAGHSAQRMAEILNEEGFSPADPGSDFNWVKVHGIRRRLGLHDPANGSATLLRDEWWTCDLAQRLKMPSAQVNRWAKRGWVHARKTACAKRWIIWADADEMERLRQLLNSESYGAAGYPEDLKKPKKRTDHS